MATRHLAILYFVNTLSRLPSSFVPLTLNNTSYGTKRLMPEMHAQSASSHTPTWDSLNTFGALCSGSAVNEALVKHPCIPVLLSISILSLQPSRARNTPSLDEPKSLPKSIPE